MDIVNLSPMLRPDTQNGLTLTKGVVAKLLVFFYLIFHSQSAISQLTNTERKKTASLISVINYLLGDEEVRQIQPSDTPVLTGHAGAGEVELSWKPIDDATSYQLYYSTESFGSLVADIGNYTNYANAERVQNIRGNSYVISDLTNFKIYYFVLVAKFTGTESAPSDEILMIPEVIRNDTGLTRAGLQPIGVFQDCSVGPLTNQQDCSHGRDVTHYDNSDGLAGFSFTKLDANGDSLPASATQWSCVQDNVTGLIWEVKSDDGGIHDKDNTYRWGGKTVLSSGLGIYYDDWDVLLDGSNNEALCGFTDWRVPLPEELLDITSYRVGQNGYRSLAAIDLDFFPNTHPVDNYPAKSYWSARGYADFGNFREILAKVVTTAGEVERRFRNSEHDVYVRLVRGDK